jgi:hypothetical protein
VAEIWGALGALAVLVVPMALAGWLLARVDRPPHRSRRRPHGKMPDSTGGRPDAD